MAKRTCDVVVIGGGPGGYVCSIRLGQLKQKVICVEKEEVGGVCLNWGCVPSKALIAASHTYEKVKDHGADDGHPRRRASRSTSNKMQDWKAGIVKKLTGGVRGLFKGNGVELVMGNARVTGPRTVEVKNARRRHRDDRGHEGHRHRDRLVHDRDPDLQVRRQAGHRREGGREPARGPEAPARHRRRRHRPRARHGLPEARLRAHGGRGHGVAAPGRRPGVHRRRREEARQARRQGHQERQGQGLREERRRLARGQGRHGRRQVRHARHRRRARRGRHAPERRGPRPRGDRREGRARLRPRPTSSAAPTSPASTPSAT